MIEVEPPKFRLGESGGKPWGGNVSTEPFPLALYRLAVSRGFASQISLGKAFGKKNNGAVGHWYRGKHLPMPEELGAVLILLKPDDQELQALIEPYSELLVKGRGSNGFLAGSESALKVSREHMQPAKTLIGSWLEKYCQGKRITLKHLSKLLGLSTLRSRTRDNLGLDTLSNILQSAPEALNLSFEEIDSLSEAVAQTIMQKLAAGHQFQRWAISSKLKVERANSTCRTYTGGEAAQELGVTREEVRLLRREFGLSMLLLEEDLERLKNRLKRTRVLREKISNTRKENSEKMV